MTDDRGQRTEFRGQWTGSVPLLPSYETTHKRRFQVSGFRCQDKVT
ncbi:hypothetical protein D1AOALGA4SA_8363 [Olavius algarvensis Delta 1 endosymbiont]|nr:hypothetical protein D1AOALGA4SA_8363 [Olavius algarvensis Delta 1 endosymbiont]